MDRSETLFEISWEVANKVGGIHTVISSKVKNIQKHFSKYYFLGPFLEGSKDVMEFEDLPEMFHKAAEELSYIGIKIHYGTWKIPGEPKAILVEHLGFAEHVNDIKKYLWETYEIDSMNSNWYDVDEVLLWSWCCGVVIEKFGRCIEGNILVHAHEWMSGGAIFQVKSLNDPKFRTIFTTHATMLGRAICGHGEDLYKILDKIDPDEYSYKIGVHTKHQIERALANHSDCFTTVSEITGMEAEKFYGKKPDVLLYNGFDNSGIEDIEELDAAYMRMRKHIEEKVRGYFNDFYDIDYENSEFFYTSGRNEFRNKGVDIYVKALGKLNERLKEERSEKNVINFFLILIGNFERNREVIRSIENYNNGNNRPEVKDHAPLSTHYIPFENEIMRALNENGLRNHRDDKVRNIIFPVYVEEKDGFFEKDYYSLITGFDLGVFASLYEPWGYTPLESISYAVPTLTSDLSGFGKSIAGTCGNACPSVEVLNRSEKSDEEEVEELSRFLYKYTNQNSKERIFKREVAKWLAMKYDWKRFVENYLKAYDIASK